ncbi:MAG: DNA translocase FtsK, partial [Candidatus Neomarinimicrobiota bacterium]
MDERKKRIIIEKDRKDKEEAKRKHTQELKEKIDSKRHEEGYQEKVIKEEVEPVNSIKLDKELESNKPDQKELEEVEKEKHIDQIPKTDDVQNLNEDPDLDSLKSDADSPKNKDLNIEKIIENEEVDIDEIEERKKPKRKYQLPSSELLENPVNISDNLSRDELVERANYLTQSMSTFGVEGKVVNVHPGPIITLFEVEPAEGVRVNKFVQLADDLARVMEASSVRVIAPIPGKSSVGIEIPNRNPATVYFKSVVNSPEFAEADSLLTLAIGKTTSGEISTLNLAKMPHLLIAGTTGSGKSVCINTIICSVLYSATPDEVKFVMIDPKKVEMTLYKQLEGYHLLKMEDINEPIITSVDNAILALRALEKEMDRRYNVLADAVVRNIGEYNQKMETNNDPIMPYIVLVVDELADLMMLSAKDVEAPIARLAQLARAVGIHLVIATQRPSVDVITGVIKA